MKNETKWSATEYPEDIADAIMYDLEMWGQNDDKKKFDDLVDALYWIKAAAENEKNDDKFKALYSMLEAMDQKISETMPWWDKE